MKALSLLFFITLGILMGCNSEPKTQAPAATNEVKSDEVFIYYFHNERRCKTCQAVEDVTKEAIKELDSQKVAFTAFNLGTDEGKQKAEEMEISGQTLLILNGNKKVNITNEGFLNARTNPDKLKEIIKENIDTILQ